MNDIDYIKLEVEKALNYSYEGSKVSKNKLEYYRYNMAEDSRYSFHINSDFLELYGIITVKYRKEKFICKLQNNRFKIEGT